MSYDFNLTDLSCTLNTAKGLAKKLFVPTITGAIKPANIAEEYLKAIAQTIVGVKSQRK
jgi:hypothetical protein